MKGLFVTGTDTGVGKTRISCGLLHALRSQGLVAHGMKPVASGCDWTAEGLRNDDALMLQRFSSSQLPYATVNPYAFEEAVAPHIVAEEMQQQIDMLHVQASFHTIARQTDYIIVEAAGGWLVPLNERQTMADMARALNLPVLLVVGLRLGCINHALLSYQSIMASGARCIGWVANLIDPEMQRIEENIASIQDRIDAPLLAYVPYSEEDNIETVAALLPVQHYLGVNEVLSAG